MTTYRPRLDCDARHINEERRGKKGDGTPETVYQLERSHPETEPSRTLIPPQANWGNVSVESFSAERADFACQLISASPQQQPVPGRATRYRMDYAAISAGFEGRRDAVKRK
jgi:hypothetical protein